MRLLTVMLTTCLISCSTTTERNGLFDNLANNETVVIYLSKYHLDSVPNDIAYLRKVRSLYISKDSTKGWTIYPPLSALQQMTDVPPFRQLPSSITELTSLENLRLVGLDLNQLPDNFDKLQNLDSLDLSMNKLTISRELENLKALRNLKYLGLFGNKVDTTTVNELKRTNPSLVVDSGLEE